MELWVSMQSRTSNYEQALHKDCKVEEGKRPMDL